MKKTIILNESQIDKLIMIEAYGRPMSFKSSRNDIGFSERQMLSAFKRIPPHAYTDDELIGLYNNLDNGNETDKIYFFERVNSDMEQITMLCENVLAKITHKGLQPAAWYMEPGYAKMLMGRRDLSTAKLKIIDNENSFYQLVLAIYQNPILWNNLFFDPRYSDTLHKFNQCILIAKGKLQTIQNNQKFNDLDAMNDIFKRKFNNANNKFNSLSQSQKNGKKEPQLTHFDTPISVRTFQRAMLNLIPNTELQKMIDFRKNKSNANPSLFIPSDFIPQNTSDNDILDSFESLNDDW